MVFAGTSSGSTSCRRWRRSSSPVRPLFLLLLLSDRSFKRVSASVYLLTSTWLRCSCCSVGLHNCRCLCPCGGCLCLCLPHNALLTCRDCFAQRARGRWRSLPTSMRVWRVCRSALSGSETRPSAALSVLPARTMLIGLQPSGLPTACPAAVCRLAAISLCRSVAIPALRHVLRLLTRFACSCLHDPPSLLIDWSVLCSFSRRSRSRQAPPARATRKSPRPSADRFASPSALLCSADLRLLESPGCPVPLARRICCTLFLRS